MDGSGSGLRENDTINYYESHKNYARNNMVSSIAERPPHRRGELRVPEEPNNNLYPTIQRVE